MKKDGGLSKVMLRFHKPLDLRGAGVLLLEKKGRSPDTLLYLPELHKVRRVSSRVAASSLFGTDFSYEDFQRLMGMSEGAASHREEDAQIDGRAVYVVSTTFPAEAKSAYERVVTSVDQETCVALGVDSYEPGGTLRKQLRVDVSQIAQEGRLWVPLSQTIVDHRDGTQTEFVIDKIEIDAKIHPKMFSERELESGAR
jgi:hypothetical protein